MNYECCSCGRRLDESFFVEGFDKRLGVLLNRECLACRGLGPPRQVGPEENARVGSKAGQRGTRMPGRLLGVASQSPARPQPQPGGGQLS